MQQVFEIANELLSRDERTRTRNLAIRTYKVIPLKSSAGLLQFVPNSLAIGNWLIDAHGRCARQPVIDSQCSMLISLFISQIQSDGCESVRGQA